MADTYIIIGKSGSGKGTQAVMLKKVLESKGAEVFYLESGARFREFVFASGHTANLSRALMEKGDLQPAFLAIHVWAHLLIEQMDENKTLIIDGTPRKLDEAKILDDALKFYGIKQPKVIYVEVSDKWATDRLVGRGRADDIAMDEIKKRLAWFQSDVVPAIEYYKNNPDYTYLQINGEQTIEQVHQEILNKLSGNN